MIELKGKSDAQIAALAVRTKSLDLVKSGLESLFASTAIYDYRDMITALVLYHDAVKRLIIDADSFFLDYAKQNHASKESVTAFVSRPSELKQLKVAGYKHCDQPLFTYVPENS